MGTSVLLVTAVVSLHEPRLTASERDPVRVTREPLPQPISVLTQRPSVTPLGITDPVLRKKAQFDAVRTIAKAEGSVRVIVEFAVPNYDGLATASRSAQDRNTAVNADAQLAAAIAPVRQAELAGLAGTQHTVNRAFQTIPFVAMTVSEGALTILEASPNVRGVTLDRLAAAVLDNTVNITGASTVWTNGYDGSGWYVAILDTGIRASHDFFAGKSILQACFALGEDGAPGAGNCPNGLSEDTTSPNAAQHHATSPNSDHGSHVAGIAAGNDPGRAPPLYGIARGADIIAVQIFSQFSTACGGGPCVLTWGSDQIAGLEHVYSLRTTYNIASVNMSLGGGFYDNQATCDADNAAEKTAIDNLRAAGIATAIASGNDGFCDGISGPGCISSAIAVGATEDSDVEAGFSNFHPTLLDIYAPGVFIMSAFGSSDSSYGNNSGTSMATPHVAGAWALMKQVDPSADVTTVFDALDSTGTAVSGTCGAPGPTQTRIQLDAAFAVLAAGRIKFSQPPDNTGEALESDLDLSDATPSPNVVKADNFVSDGRPITAVRWWGSNLPVASSAAASAVSRPEESKDRRSALTKAVSRVVSAGTYDDRIMVAKLKEGYALRTEAHVAPEGEGAAVAVGGDTCATATVIGTLPYSDTGNTCGFADNYDEICPFDTPTSPDVVYRFTAPVNMTIDITLCTNSAYDTKLYVYDTVCGAYQSGTAIACTDDACSTPSYFDPFVSDVGTVSLLSGHTYYIVVDGFGGDCGNYTIDVTGCVPPVPGACLLVNNDFEAGGLCGWQFTPDSGSGTWVSNDSTFDPASPDGPIAPCGGNYSAITNPTGPGLRVLSQDVAIPAAGSVILEWTDIIRNHAGVFENPNQQFRVQIRNPIDDSILTTVFATNPGDNAFNTCTPRCADISAFAGQTVRVAFTEEDSLFYQNIHVDDVCITPGGLCSTGACCEAGTGACLLGQVAANCIAAGGIYQGDDTTVCTECPPIICGDGIVGTGEQCDPPDGIDCDDNCQTIYNPPIDGWLISFHEPLSTGGSAEEPLGLYFCDADVVTLRATGFGSCDGSSVREYLATLSDCCLLHANVDSRSSATPAQTDAFHEESCFEYDIDIQAVVGYEYVDVGGTCMPFSTGNSATDPYWAWQTTGINRGVRPALETFVSLSPPDWLYGPWSEITPACSERNMAFSLLTDADPTTGDCNLNGVPDYCDITFGGYADGNNDGIPDVCQCPVAGAAVMHVQGKRNRFLSINVPDVGRTQAIRVTFLDLPPDYAYAEGRRMWVSNPVEYSEVPSIVLRSDALPGRPWFWGAQLSCTADFRDWNALGTIHVRNVGIVPGGRYIVQVIDQTCETTMEASYSAPTEVPTSRWGDTVSNCSTIPCGASNNLVEISDVVAILDKYTSDLSGPMKSRTDIEPSLVDFVINISDVTYALDAFTGDSYSFSGPPAVNPCP